MSLHETSLKLQFISGTMSGIHEALPGKDNREKREVLLEPWRKLAIEIGYERYSLVKEHRTIKPKSK